MQHLLKDREKRSRAKGFIDYVKLRESEENTNLQQESQD